MCSIYESYGGRADVGLSISRNNPGSENFWFPFRLRVLDATCRSGSITCLQLHGVDT